MFQFLLSLLPFLSTLLGGFVAIRLQGRVQLILGFTAGMLLGIVCFDLLPEIFELLQKQGFDARGPMVALACGFLFFSAVSALFHSGHTHSGAHVENHAPFRHPRLGLFSALALTAHSFMDGVSIGFGFQVSSSVGVALAGAVIAHDFADGFNTVNLMLAHGNTRRRAQILLLINALSPVLGAASTLLFRVPPQLLVIYLGFFAGFLLHIATTGVLPEPPANRRLVAGTLALMVAGAAFIFTAQSLLP